MALFDSLKNALNEAKTTAAEVYAAAKPDYDRLPESLRKSLTVIDGNYSMNPFGSVDLDMPETLGLEKLTYTPKSEDEIYDLAKQYLEAAYTTSYDRIENDYLKRSDTVNDKKSTELDKLAASLVRADEDEQKAAQKAGYNTLKQGLARSSIKEEWLKDIASGADRNREGLSSASGIKTDSLERQLENLQEQKLNALKNLDAEHALKLDAKITDLVKQENTVSDAVTKYNNSVDEKEANYLRTKQAAYDAAVKNKYDAAKRNMELAARLGEDYVADLKQQEKLQAVKEFIAASGMPADEAAEFISKDTLFREQLGDRYYNELGKWVTGLRL